MILGEELRRRFYIIRLANPTYMTRIVSIIASPRKNGFGATLAGAVAEGARASGAEVVEYRLNDMETYRQCQNCGACKESGECVLKDDIAPIIDSVREADGIILCTSINFNDADGLFKMVLDRFYCFLDMNASTILPKGKKAAVIVTAGADETGAERVAKGLEAIMTQHFFCKSVGTLPYCTWFMPVGMPVDADVMTEAREMGARMVRSDPGISTGSS